MAAVVDATTDFGWIASHDGEAWYVLGLVVNVLILLGNGDRAYHMQQTPRSDCATPADSHSCQDGHVGTDPAVLLNNNVPAQSWAIAAGPPPRVDWIRSTDQLYVGAEDTPRSDRDAAGVGDAAVGTNVYVVAYGDIIAVVAVEGSFDDDAITHAASGEAPSFRRGFTTWMWRLGVGPKSEDLAK